MSYDDLLRRDLVPDMNHNAPQADQGIQMLRDRLVPGSGGLIEQLVIANQGVTVLASTPKKGVLKITKKSIKVGGSDISSSISGLHERVLTVRHYLGGDAPAFGVLVLSEMPKAQITMADSIAIGSPKAIFDFITDNHNAAAPRDIQAIGHELEGIFFAAKSFANA